MSIFAPRGYRVHFVPLIPSQNICNALVPNEHELKRCEAFYNKLEASILEEGIKNPILVNAGFCPSISQRYLPDNMKQNSQDILVCCKWGGSRLYFAHKYDLEIAVLVSDFIGKYSAYEECFTLEDVQRFIVLPIREIVLTINGLWIKA